MSTQDIELTDSNTYEQQLLDEGKVIASFTDRRTLISEQLLEQAQALGATIGTGSEVDALLDEVTALVEHTTVYVGEFEQQFLGVQPECLILTMRLNHKYFPFFEPDTGQLRHRFLIDKSKVIASFTDRRTLISEQLLEQAQALGATIGTGSEVDALLDEVTALVEHPTVYVGEFEQQFLGVPPECLILTMRLNQKYFPLFEPDTGKLTHRFLIVSNMQIADPSHIIEGNQRVVRPRLADAQFFFKTDLKTPLADRVVSLASTVYTNKLAPPLNRVDR